MIDNPMHIWSEVELWRWQYGSLPGSNDTRKLDICVAARKMADALEGAGNEIPSTFNSAMVIRYMADEIEKLKIDLELEKREFKQRGK